jgi:hypothetical protein
VAIPDQRSRNYRVQPGRDFRDALLLPGWEQQSVWGYDTGAGGFFAQLWRNGSRDDAPEIWLSHGSTSLYPQPSCLLPQIMRAAQATAEAVVCGLGLADPTPTLRPRSELQAAIAQHAQQPSPYNDGVRHHLQQVLDHGTRPQRVDAVHHLVTAFVYLFAQGTDVEAREQREFYSGGDTALWWALGRSAALT